MTLIAVCGDASTTTSFALAAMWPDDGVVLFEADPSGGDLAAWLDVPEVPGVGSAVAVAPSGSWPVIETQLQTVRGIRVLVAPIRASEASVAVREAAARLVPTMAALGMVTVVADCGRVVPGCVPSTVLDAGLIVVTVRQPSGSPRAAAARLDRVTELVDILCVADCEVVVVVVGEVPYTAAEIGFLLNGSTGRVPVLVLANDPAGASLAGGRDRPGRGFQRTALGRSAATAAHELGVRIAALRYVGVVV